MRREFVRHFASLAAVGRLESTKRRGCRKKIILPDIENHAIRSAAHRNLLTALARPFRPALRSSDAEACVVWKVEVRSGVGWKDLLESGRFATIKALAEAVACPEQAQRVEGALSGLEEASKLR